MKYSADTTAVQTPDTGTDKKKPIASTPLKPWLKATVWAVRILVGALFVFSGIVKAIDLWGFVFKMEEYLAAWGMTQPRSLVLMAAMAVSAYETVFGFLLMTGCYKRVAPWALTLSMAVMLPLTAYIAIA
ncbi:MAG: DoxX family membrane protein, partial [Muribaculaceae bacterium]|nr:DoxX family membrane protein [Muribaculaceae bacterium]